MDLTIESAFSTGGLVGHASYLLLVLSMMMRTISLLRMIVILSALTALVYDIVWLKDPVGAFWETLLIAVNLVQLAITRHQNNSARFTDEERKFVEGHLPDLAPRQRRKLLNRGNWIAGEKGTVLTHEGIPVERLVYLASGRALVHAGGHPVAVCEPGAFIGEMTVIDGEPASGTVTLQGDSRYWAIDANLLRDLLRKEPDIRSALEAGFSRNMRDKLVRSNQFILDSGGVRKPSPPNEPARV